MSQASWRSLEEHRTFVAGKRFCDAPSTNRGSGTRFDERLTRPVGHSIGPHGRLSGFQAEFVGLVVGFLRRPDKDRPNAFSSLRAICRVCRVFLAVERSGEISEQNQSRSTCPALLFAGVHFWTPVGLQKRGWAALFFRKSLRSLVDLVRFEKTRILKRRKL